MKNGTTERSKAQTGRHPCGSGEPVFAVARLAILFLLSAFCLPVHAGYDAKYKAYRGDLDNNGYTDLYLSRSPDVVIIPLDDLSIPIVTTRPDRLVLMQSANRTFTVDTTLSPADLATLKTWAASSVQLVVRDVNVDGQKDLFIKNFAGDASFGSGIADQVLYAPHNSSPASVRAADSSFRQFFTQIHGWATDKDYFVRTAIENDWYHYEGQVQTGWWYIHYIDFYYQYGGGKRYLDDADNPQDPNNVPAFCADYPANCWYNSNVGYWWIYGTYRANIEVIIEYEHFNQDALLYAQAVGTAFDDPNVALQANPAQAEAILESYLQAQVGETLAGVLRDPLPWPDFPPEALPEPQTRKLPKSLPGPANDPDFFPDKWKWKILTRAGIIVCGLLICSADGESDEWIEWREIGWEWAVQDVVERNIEGQPKVIVGEGEGKIGNVYVYERIPDAAQAYGAIYFNPGKFTSASEWNHSTDVALWFMNWGWVTSMMMKQALFYDIGLYAPRITRGLFYPCERHTLENYPLRQEIPFGNTGGYSYGPCTLDNPLDL